jgi:hypothetical protein
MKVRFYQAMMLALLGLISSKPLRAQTAAEYNETGKPLKAALLVQNRAGAQYQAQTDQLNDYITAHLTEKGFAILDKDLVLGKFREAGTDSEKQPVRDVADVMHLAKNEVAPEDASSGASALRVAQSTGADYVVMASLTSVGQDNKVFHGQGTAYKTDLEVHDVTVHVSLKVLEGASGSTLYSDTVAETKRIGCSEFISCMSTEVFNQLLDQAAAKVSDHVASKVPRLQLQKVAKADLVEFSVKSNVEGSAVEVDGAAMGTAPGTFKTTPGIHQMRVSRERYATWEKTVNIAGNGQTFNVALELSDEGLHRDKRQAGVDIAKEQSAADAKSKVMISEGEKTKRENSYIKFKGEIGTLVTDHDSQLNVGK